MTTFYSHSVSIDATSWEGRSLRQLLPVTGVASLGQIRVTFSAGSGGMQIDHASIAILGGAAFPNVTTDPPVVLAFSGNAGFNIAASATIVSDWATLAVQTTDQLAIIIDFTAGGTKGTFLYDADVGAATQYKVGDSSYQSATVTGYGSSGAVTVISLVETQVTPSSGFVFQPFAI